MKSERLAKLKSRTTPITAFKVAHPHGAAPYTPDFSTPPWHPKCPDTLDT